VIVRPATAADLPATLALVNHYVETGVAHFATRPFTLEEAARDWTARHARYPEVVATDEAGLVIGLAKAAPWKERGGYAYSVEVGIYVSPDHLGQGVGTALYAALVPAIEAAGFRTLVAGITLPNPASVALHERLGFTHAGTLGRIGWKHDAWRDVGYWVLHVGDVDEAPGGV